MLGCRGGLSPGLSCRAVAWAVVAGCRLGCRAGLSCRPVGVLYVSSSLSRCHVDVLTEHASDGQWQLQAIPQL